MLLLTALFAVLFGLLFLQQAESLRHARDEAQARALDLAQGYARHYERLVRDHLAMLDILLRLRGPGLREAGCAEALRQVVAATPSLGNLALVDGDGRLRCAARDGAMTGAAADAARRVLAAGRPMLGMSGSDGQQRSYLALGQPLAGGEARAGAILAFIDRDWLNAHFAATVPAGVVLRIFDSDGVFVVRQPDPACCVGRSGRHLDGIGEAIASGRGQVTRSRWLDGVTRLQADLPLAGPLSGVVSIGIPENLVVNDAQRRAGRLAWPLAALALALYAVVWFFSERAILRPLRALAEGARRVSAGETGFRIPPLPGPGEFAELGREFNDMAESLAARERRIAEDMARLRLAGRVFNQATEAITITDAEANILEVNPRFSEITGYAREEVIGRNPRILQSGRQDAAFYRAMWDALLAEGRWSGEIWNRRKDGEIYPEWLTITALRDEAGRVTHYVAVFTDLTKRKAADAALRESRERLDTLIEAVPDAVFFKDGGGRWQVVNGAGRRLFALDGVAWQGRSDPELALVNPDFSGEHMACWESDEDAWAAGQPMHFTEVVHRPEGGSVILDVAKVPLYDEDGGRKALVVVGRDVTELRRNAEELERRVAERTAELEAANRELEAFSYSVSHDLRAPLRAINGFSRLLEEEAAHRLDENARGHLARVRAASLKMGALIDDLLELARVARHEMRKEAVDLSALAREIADELAAAEPARRVAWSIADGIAAFCDQNLIRAVLHNLLGNAWKYTSKKESARITFGVEEADGEPGFFVRDDGAGFDMRYAGKLFGAFQRLHAPSEFHGTGIGLATVARIVHRHGGRVWAEGRVNEGATFWFTLPPEKLSPHGTAGKLT
jgi:PAS domain S-box-containing protein